MGQVGISQRSFGQSCSLPISRLERAHRRTRDQGPRARSPDVFVSNLQIDASPWKNAGPRPAGSVAIRYNARNFTPNNFLQQFTSRVLHFLRGLGLVKGEGETEREMGAGGHGESTTYKGLTMHHPKRWHVVTGKGLCAVMWFWILYRAKQDGPVVLGWRHPWEGHEDHGHGHGHENEASH